ncbi:MAG TPA: hypothetical protein PK644_10460, partial [bacterium]|nr:hypothetical protein [bacterium]
MNYFHLRRLLEAGDEQNLRQIFEGHEPPSSGQPRRPTVLPVGRLELHFPDGFRLRTGHLDTHSGHLTVLAENGQTCRLEFDLAMKEVLLLVTWTSRLKPVEIVRVPAWEFVGEYLRSISFTEPEMFSTASVSGWVQPRPADPPYCVAYQKGQNCLLVTISTGATGRKAVTRAATLLAACRKRLEALCKENKRWWSNYWESLPKVSLPNERLQFLYRYGLYKFAGLTNPAGVPATLQGPWIEEYQMPPWSSDYHFNINVQMCYWPAYQANRLQHLLPLFRMVWSWREQLRQNARLFAGINDGYVLPHAVDDRGKCMGGFWTGTIDHGCTAWVGKMMYDYYLYGGEKEFLAEIAYPFMEGAMKVFTVMLEKRGGGWYLPVSVSPEYRGAAMNAWGANSSFQLACIHWLIEALQNS